MSGDGRLSCSFAWSSRISQRWRRNDAIRCGRLPTSIHFTAFGAWRDSVSAGSLDGLMSRSRLGLPGSCRSGGHPIDDLKLPTLVVETFAERRQVAHRKKGKPGHGVEVSL